MYLAVLLVYPLLGAHSSSTTATFKIPVYSWFFMYNILSTTPARFCRILSLPLLMPVAFHHAGYRSSLPATSGIFAKSSSCRKQVKIHMDIHISHAHHIMPCRILLFEHPLKATTSSSCSSRSPPRSIPWSGSASCTRNLIAS
jgi:hypothetical protein